MYVRCRRRRFALSRRVAFVARMIPFELRLEMDLYLTHLMQFQLRLPITTSSIDSNQIRSQSVMNAKQTGPNGLKLLKFIENGMYSSYRYLAPTAARSELQLEGGASKKEAIAPAQRRFLEQVQRRTSTRQHQTSSRRPATHIPNKPTSSNKPGSHFSSLYTSAGS